MKMSKKMLSIILAIMMIITIVPINASAATHTLSIVADKTNVNIGDTVKISVTISQKSNLGCLTVDIKYDAFVFEAVSLKGAGLFTTDAVHGMEMANVKYQTGKARFVAVGGYALEEGGTLFIAEFKAIRAGVCDFALAIEESLDTNNSVVDIVANTVNVTVVEDSTTEPDEPTTKPEEPTKPDEPTTNPSNPSGSPKLTVATSDSYVNMGDKVTVTISLSEKSGLGALAFKINYDSSVLKPIDMWAGDLGATVNVNNCMAAMASATTFEEAGVVCTIVFEVIGTGSSKVFLDVTEACDDNYFYVNVETNSVSITAEDSTYPTEPPTSEPDEPCADGHTWSNWIIQKNATCNDNGYKARSCIVCGEKETEVISSTGVCDYTRICNSPTCISNGIEYDQCKYCDKIINKKVLPATGHEYQSTVTSPTCTEEGYTEYSCYRCGDYYVNDYIDATGHNYTWYTMSIATCETDGITIGQCSVCENVKIEGTPATGHNYATAVTAPTCTEQGYTTYTCDCGDSYKDSFVDATGHNYTSVVTAPTCTKQGYTTYTCACGDSYTDDFVDALGHTTAVSENILVAPTCTEKGSKEVVVTCTICNKEMNRETTVVDAKGHNLVNGDCTNCDYTENTGNEDNNDDNDVTNPSDDCSCNCHKSGISNFFFKIGLFFQKIFGSNKYCGCGVAHY